MSAPAVPVAAWVAGEPVTVAEVETRLSRARAASFGPRLPLPSTAQGRNARRWMVQLLCAERIVRGELAARGVAASQAPRPLAIDRALALGGVAAAVLAALPEMDDVVRSWPVSVDPAEVEGYLERNADLACGLDARDDVAALLHGEAADRAFARWLEERMMADVVLAHGYEHPADPSHPDATHHH